MIFYKGDGSGKALSKAAWSWCGSNPQGFDRVTLLARECSGSSLVDVGSLGEPGHIEGRGVLLNVIASKPNQHIHQAKQSMAFKHVLVILTVFSIML